MSIKPVLLGSFLFSLLLLSCAPVLNKSYLKEGAREVSFQALRQNDDAYTGRLFVFGGVIVQTRLTQQGSEIEAMHVPVDRYGRFKERGLSEGRFLAIAPSDRPTLDPEVFAKSRRFTFAGEFVGLRSARIDEMDYIYPVFQIKQIHLWPPERVYYPAYYYDPWFYPFPYYYRGPWWGYPFYYNNYYYYNYRGTPPSIRRSRPPQPPPATQAPSPGQGRELTPEIRPGMPEPGPQRR